MPASIGASLKQQRGCILHFLIRFTANLWVLPPGAVDARPLGGCHRYARLANLFNVNIIFRFYVWTRFFLYVFIFYFFLGVSSRSLLATCRFEFSGQVLICHVGGNFRGPFVVSCFDKAEIWCSMNRFFLTEKNSLLVDSLTHLL